MKQTLLHIILCSLLLFTGSISLYGAKKVAPQVIITPAMSIEEEQQFKYYYYEALRLFQEAKYEESFSLFQFCQQIYPHDAMVNLYIGIFYSGYGKRAYALPYYRRAYELNPEECWTNYALSLYKSKNIKDRQEAIRVLESTVQLLPKDENAWEYLRQVYTNNHQYKEALKAQDALDSIIGYNEYSALNRYETYCAMGKYKHAIAELNRYLEDYPTNLRFHILRIELYHLMGVKYEVMEKACQEILALDPRNIIIMNNYAYLLATHNGDLNKAESLSRYTIQAEPNNPTFLDTYAWILYLQKEYQLAKIYIQKAIQNADKKDTKEIEKHYKAILKKTK
ncbi:MAG: hypothetical protein J6J29_04115 [Paludibacteraceae bacterium]|nr:hypothetical protein [Paludibacteraceae bacterium]